MAAVSSATLWLAALLHFAVLALTTAAPPCAVFVDIVRPAVWTTEDSFSTTLRVTGSSSHAAGPESPTTTVLASRTSPFFSAQLAAAVGVQVYFLNSAGHVQLDTSSVAFSVVAGGAGSQLGTTVGTDVLRQEGLAMSSPALHANTTLVPALLSLSSQVDALSFRLPVVPPGAVVDVTFTSVISPAAAAAVPANVTSMVLAYHSPGGSGGYLTATSEDIVVACDRAASCSSAGRCKLQGSMASCECLPGWLGDSCETATMDCEGYVEPLAVVVPLPHLPSPEQTFARIVMTAVSLAILVRLALCCSAQWFSEAPVMPDQPNQLSRNWRNRWMLAAVMFEAFALAAPAFAPDIPWSTFLPLKYAARTYTTLAVRHYWAYVGLVGAGSLLGVVTLLAVACKPTSHVSRSFSKSQLRAGTFASDASLQLPTIQAGSTNNVTVIREVAGKGAGAIGIPRGQVTGWLAVLVYLMATFLFQPLFTSALLVWRCGFPFRVYSSFDLPSQECPLSQECWSIPHLVACALSAISLLMLATIATVTLWHTQQQDSGAAGMQSGLRVGAMLQVAYSPRHLILAIAAKMGMAWAEVGFAASSVRGVPVTTAIAAAFTTLLFAHSFLGSVVAAPRVNIIARLSLFVAMITTWLLLGLRWAAPGGPTLLQVDVLEHSNLDTEWAGSGPVLIAAGLWLLAVLSCLVVYCIHKGRRHGGASLFARGGLVHNASGLSRSGGVREWTGSFHLVNTRLDGSGQGMGDSLGSLAKSVDSHGGRQTVSQGVSSRDGLELPMLPGSAGSSQHSDLGDGAAQGGQLRRGGDLMSALNEMQLESVRFDQDGKEEEQGDLVSAASSHLSRRRLLN